MVESSSEKGKFEDIKGVIRSRKSKKDRHYNGQKKKDKQGSTENYTETKNWGSPIATGRNQLCLKLC